MMRKNARWGGRANARQEMLRRYFFSDEQDGRRGRRRRRGGRGGGHSGGPFDGRRPLRYLAKRLDLDSEQFEQLAALFSELKTERAQAAVDRRRAAAHYADALTGEKFDSEKAAQAVKLSAAAQARFDEFVTGLLARVHDVLDDRQRIKLASLLRELPSGLR